ncbi:iron-sulfur cluster assembly scaffold protein [Legionella lytica]|uniref:Iron-sulfur cluster assembly scaffold protein n=1 Tax=Legionella lytica TaxID=96232 RepID=A0ABY4Y4R3_9GAMM|nr:iron-sulfur cluster assembly scaffold protein [Legionella lytica]USQ12565.1 iron-sulfur cluster assembly scaffold protein [Legionella lytica]
MMYNKTVLDYFFSPAHVGIIDLNDHTVVVKNNQKKQGTIELYMQCGQNRVIQRICFKTNGNPYLIAGLEWLCRQIEGKLIDELPPIDYQLLVNELSIPVTQYPLALRIFSVFKETLILMNNKLLPNEQHT